jgi:hypothetical protein
VEIDSFTGGFIKKTVSENTLSTGGSLYLSACGSFSVFFQIFKQN